ncbi:cytochrome c biogenesis protein CcsA [Calderihabitans maritimus]|uniref:Cytochrome c assembly protein n=1 Tax=Calderihabitans maritimus TaxID=1246530 RepID=A0A1Z5HVM1_9FIRM|nr:cytochrome c biogenesis protein CcsA [Calderihabitans maritimus]GAW93593.1 cytochrome c assembly protein [Calderihabitans maritimus]
MVYDVYLVLGVIGLYALATIGYLFGIIFNKDKLNRIALWIGATGAFFHTVAVVLRWYLAGHAPTTLYELNSFGGWLAVLAFLLARYWRRDLNLLGMVVFPVVFLVMGWGLTKYTLIEPLKPEYQSFWLTLHVLFAFLATACYLLSFSAAVLYLWGNKRVLKKLPPRQVLEELSAKFIGVGFINHAVMVITGSIWADVTWGRYWGWDPVETWSLVTWLIYGLYLHLYFTMGWRGRKLAWLAVIAMGVVIFAYYYVPHLPVKIFS